MPRPKLHRAVCDCLDCTVEPKFVGDASMAARQEPPPKCLVIYTNHARPLGQDETASSLKSALENVPRLESLAKAGSCSLIYYREAPQGGNLTSLSQLLNQVFMDMTEVGRPGPKYSQISLLQHPSDNLAAPKQLCERYNNLQTGFISTASQACLLAEAAGMQVIPILSSLQTHSSKVAKGLSGWPPPDLMVQTIMTALGLSNNVANGTSQFMAAIDDDDSIDLLFLYIAVDNAPKSSGCNASRAVQLDAGTLSLQRTPRPTNLPAGVALDEDLDEWQCAGSCAALHQWLDAVIGLLLQYPPFSSSVLTAILLENQDYNDMPQASPPSAVFEEEDFPRVLKPQQSHCISNMQTVRHSRRQSSLMIQHLPGVVRRDNVQTLSEIKRYGGGGCILAEHVLPELAYKLGRAAKYGA